jgi:iron-sulfur cluster insertion protein
MSESAIQTGILITDSAIRRVGQIAAGKDNPDLKLRVFVEGGGCSGFQYGFQLDEAAEAGDLSIERDGITVLVDPLSLQYLMGAEIDFIDDLEGARFVVRNPNAATTCGCGSSFGI